MKKYIFAILMSALSVCGFAQVSPVVFGEIHTIGGGKYEFNGTLDRMKFFCTQVGCFLCIKSLNTIGLPEKEPGDQIFRGGFEESACGVQAFLDSQEER